MQSYDFIIVGAGSAGAVLANRLSANPDHKVLLLEAGGTDNKPYVRVPIGYGKTFYNKRVNWKYYTEPEQSLANRKIYWPRGRLLGGSSSINAMVYVRGHRLDYDEWGLFAQGWDWKNVAPYFQRMENWDGDYNDERGTEGPLGVHSTTSETHPQCKTFFSAAQELNIPFNKDYNADHMQGVSHYQITTKGGWRASSSYSYLKPIRKRQNLTVHTNALVETLNIENKHITGVNFTQRGVSRTATSRKSVVLCAGAVNSPKLLEHSGIGNSDILHGLGIEPKHHLPQVGENLSDHLGADIICKTNSPSLNQTLGTFTGRLKSAFEYLLYRRGPLSLSVNHAGGFIRSDPSLARPDLQLYFSPLSYTRAPEGTRELIKPDRFPGFSLGFNPCRPTSVGSTHIQSNDPQSSPAIKPNYLSTDHDWQLMLTGMQLMRNFTNTRSMQSLVVEEIVPGHDTQTEESLRQFVSENAWTVYHPCCTCRMGEDENTSVVDSRLKVHGLSGLRIADASVFPAIPSGNTNAPTIMVGEKAGDIILEDFS